MEAKANKLKNDQQQLPKQEEEDENEYLKLQKQYSAYEKELEEMDATHSEQNPKEELRNQMSIQINDLSN